MCIDRSPFSRQLPIQPDMSANQLTLLFPKSKSVLEEEGWKEEV
jgi:hypothetical protein